MKNHSDFSRLSSVDAAGVVGGKSRNDSAAYRAALSPGVCGGRFVADLAPGGKAAINTRNFLEPRHAVAQILPPLLADEYQLYIITRDYHWNVSGPDYHALRLLFQLQHGKATLWVDAVAEQVREKGMVRTSWMELKKSARRTAAAGFGLSAAGMLTELLCVHDEMISQLHADCEVCLPRSGDKVLLDFLVDLAEQHENAASMFRSQVEASPANAASSR